MKLMCWAAYAAKPPQRKETACVLGRKEGLPDHILQKLKVPKNLFRANGCIDADFLDQILIYSYNLIYFIIFEVYKT